MSFGFFYTYMNKKEEKKCSACGNSPINHRLSFVSGLIDQEVGKVAKSISSSFIFKKMPKIDVFIERWLFVFLKFFGLVRYNTDVEKSVTGRSKLIWEEAKSRGIYMEQVVVFGKHVEHYRAKIDGKFFYFQSLPIPPGMPNDGYDWIDDKDILADKLKKVGIASPQSIRVASLTEALKAFDSLAKPLIVKPQYGSRGRHTTTNIHTKEEMEKAYIIARQITPSMVVQEHLFGSVSRATVVDGVLVGFYKADLPYVIGDGIHTIKELILEKNKNRPERISEISIDDGLESFISREGYNLESIPGERVEVTLLAKTGRLYGGHTKEMLPEVHPKIHSIFQKAGEVVGVPVMGFDLIIPDPKADPDTQTWGIIECNSLPFIDLHYFAFEGEPINVAKYVWNLWDKKSK